MNHTSLAAVSPARSLRVAAGAAAVLCLALLAGCAPDPLEEIPLPGQVDQPWLTTAAAEQPWNLLLLTLDTTRLDRLGCYGYAAPTTPNLDRLAAEGILFEHAVTPVPITLPAHATMLTGLDPPEHGVRHNGTYVLAERFVTIAEVLRAQGYATSATIGAFPVAAEFGLDQGFDRYDDDFPSDSRTREHQTLQRTADQVTANTIEQLREHVSNRPGTAFFHWSHYFDPHFPYTPPGDYAQRFDVYAGEIAFMDAEIGRLLDELERLGLRATTWILCVADHGEAFGEHGEETHGMLTYTATIHVPCILVPPGDWQGLPAGQVRGRRVAETIGLRDLAPTLLNAAGLPRDALPASGASLLPLLAGQSRGPRVVYMESLMPFLDHGWCELRGVRTDRWSYIRAPERELYDLRQDANESNNLATELPEVTQRLEDWCAQLAVDGEGTSGSAPDPETIAKLRSLGYIAGGGSAGTPVNDRDPKKLMQLFDKVNDASAALGLDRLDEARHLLETVRAEDPDNPEACRLLAALLLRTGDPQGAADLYAHLVSRRPTDVEMQLNLGRALLQSDDPQRAGELLLGVLERRPGDLAALNLYPQALARQGRLEDASRFLDQQAERGGPHAAQAWTARASFEWAHQNHEEAQRFARQALAADPDIAAAEALVGEWLWREARDAEQAGAAARASGQQAEARRRLEHALELDPIESIAAFRLAWIMRQEGKRTEAAELYRRALAGNTAMGDARVNLANLLVEMNRLPEAISHYEIARKQGFEAPLMLVNFGVALVRTGQRDRAAEVWERALALNPDPQTAEGIRRNLQMLRQQ